MEKITDQLQALSNQIYRWVPQPEPSFDLLNHTQIVAHRGCWNRQERLENTMAAFLESLEHNIWAIEFDIRWTRDDVPVVHHDATTERVFGESFRISDMRFDQLRSEVAQIPSLQEVVQTMGGRRHLMIELKSPCSPQQRRILKQVLSPLEPVDQFHLMSLNLNHFNNLKLFPNRTFVSIARTNIRSIFRDTCERRLGGLTGHYLILTDRLKEACHEQGISVGTGFPDSENLFYREVNRGVDWIFSDHASHLAALKDQKPFIEQDQ
jgi:glycerophosphoryl diester phosphodiesterase